MPFKKNSVLENIFAGMKNSKQQMIEEKVWTDSITFEEWASFAGSHIEITEVPNPPSKMPTDHIAEPKNS